MQGEGEMEEEEVGAKGLAEAVPRWSDRRITWEGEHEKDLNVGELGGGTET